MQENFSFPAGGEVFSLDIPFYRTPRGNGEHPIDRTYGHGAIPRPYAEWCPRNASELEFQSVVYRRESAPLAPELENDSTKNNLVHSAGHRVYKCAHLGGQNGNSRLNSDQ